MRTATPPPSRYIDLKLSERRGGGTFLPETARTRRKCEAKELIKDTEIKPEGADAYER